MDASPQDQRRLSGARPEGSQAIEHAIAFGVAVALVATALADGGYGAEIRAAVTVLIWAAIGLGIAFGLLPRSDPPRAALIAGCLLGALALLSGVSMAWASDDGRVFLETVRVAGYLGLFILIVLASGPEGARPWLLGVGLGVMAIAVLAVTSRLLPGLPGGDEEIAAFLPNAVGRLSFPIGYWNGLAAMLAMGVVLATWLSASDPRWLVRGLAAAVLPVFGLALYLTSSRGGVGAALLGSVVLIALGPKRLQMLAGLGLGAAGAGVPILIASGQSELLDGLTNDAARTQGAGLLVVLIGCVGAVAALRYALDPLLSRAVVSRGVARISAATAIVVALVGIAAANPAERFEEFKEVPPEEGAAASGFVASHLASGSGSGRYQYWGEALDAYGSEPLLGIGAGGYESYWLEHATISRVVRDAHSLFVEKLAELGPLGVLALVGFFAIGPFVAFRSRAAPPSPEVGAGVALLATGVISTAIEWTWEIPAAFAPVVLAVALLTGPALASRVPSGEPRPERRYGRFGWGVATVAVASVCALIAADAFLVENSLSRSRSAAGEADLERAEDHARDAIALQPWAAEPRLQLALVQESANQLADAQASAAEATERAPRDWRTWLARARIETRSGDVGDARAALREARRLNPRNPLFAGLPRPSR